VQVCTIAKHARTGKLTANIYTDGWPDFTTTVCHILSPALSDVSSSSGNTAQRYTFLAIHDASSQGCCIIYYISRFNLLPNMTVTVDSSA